MSIKRSISVHLSDIGVIEVKYPQQYLDDYNRLSRDYLHLICNKIYQRHPEELNRYEQVFAHQVLDALSDKIRLMLLNDNDGQ